MREGRGKKLLVYSDGGKSRRPYASYAAYLVDPSVNWASDWDAHRRLACRALHEPVVHVCRQPLYPRRMSNTTAEAMALRMAVNWAGVWCREHREVPSVEFCSDDRSLVEWARGGGRLRSGQASSEGQLIRANVRRNLSGVAVKWTWIPGDLMKATIINH